MVFKVIKEILTTQQGWPSLAESKITREATLFGDLGFESLGVVEFMLSLEDEIDVDIPDVEQQELVKLPLGQIANYLEKRLKGKVVSSASGAPVSN